MNPSRETKAILTILASALTLVACAGTPGVASPSPVVAAQTPAGTVTTPIYGRSTGEVRTPITVQLILSQTPRLDEPAQVTLVVTSTLDAPGTMAEILLPPGAVATGGSLTWTGDLKAQQPHRLQATIKFQQEGDSTLQGKALRPAGGRDVWGDLAVLYLHVTREAGQIGFPKKPRAPHTGGRASPTITATTP